MSCNKKRRQLFLLVCLYCITVFAYANLPGSARANPGEIPSGLSASDWGSIQSQMQAGKYKSYPGDNGGYHSSNPAHGWQIGYGADGTTTLSPRDRKAAAYHLSIKLSAIGYNTLESLHRPEQISSENNTLDYHWNDTLTERWINSETELEQWFFLKQRPEGVASGRPLTLQLTLDSNLSATQAGNNIRFVNPYGTSITYNKLKVWDADGRNLLAKMQLIGQQLSLVIDDSGAHYPLTIDPSFQQQAYFKASNTGGSDGFGFSVAIDGDTVVVGANGEFSSATGVDGDQSDNTAGFAGAVYVFTRSTVGVWSQQAYLKASNTEAFDEFGRSVGIAGDTVVVGAFRESSNATGVNGNQGDNSADETGAAYVFIRSAAGVWSQQAYLKASNTGEDDNFGESIAIDGDTVVIGANREASSDTGVNGNQSDDSAVVAGAVYVFTRNGSTWSQQAYLKASNTEAADFFGRSVGISGDTVVVGANGEGSNATGVDGDQSSNSANFSGAAYVFTRSGNTWSQQAYLKASNTEALDNFGFSVAIAGETVVVGAFGEASTATGIDGDQGDNSVNDAGAVYVFTRSAAGVWSQQAYLKASNTGADDQFGRSVAIADDSVVVGAFAEASNANGVDGDQSDNLAIFTGAAYVFTRSAAGVWSQQAYLKASNSGVRDRFGDSVAIAGNTVVIGATDEDSNATGVDGDQSDNSVNDAGAVYVFNLVPECTLDVDGNASADALTDGLLFIRYLFGLRNESLIVGAVASDCVDCSTAELEPILEQCGATGTSDIDGNGEVDALTDGLLIIRYLFGIRGDALIAGSVANDCNRCTVLEIETYIQGLLP